VKKATRAQEMSPKTRQRRQFIEDAVKDQSLPAEVRKAAQAAWQKVKDPQVTKGGHGKVQPEYDRLKLKISEAGARRTKTCRECKEDFTPQRSDAMYCSAACRKRVSRYGRAGIGRKSGAVPDFRPDRISGRRDA
jgi:hypothetical protein